MASTQVVPFTDIGVPAHIQGKYDHLENIDEKVNIPQLSFRGKVWRQIIKGEEKPLLNNEGEPVSTVHVVILNHQKARSRSYYEGAFEEGKSKPPVCWSLDGEKPDPAVKLPQCDTCAKCEKSMKGSKITGNGKETTACAVYKRVAIVPLTNIEGEPLLLRMPQTSMWDKNNEENESKGYYAWDQYLDMLRQRGAKHTGLVATKVRFDSRVAYPKLVFAASRWLSPEEIELALPRFDAPEVMTLLNASEESAAKRAGDTPAATPKGDDDETPPPPPARQPAAAKPAAQTDDDDGGAPPPPPPASAKKANGAAKPAAAAAPDPDEAPPPPPAGKPATKPAAAAAPAAAKPAAAKGKSAEDKGLTDLVNEWAGGGGGDEE